MQRYGKIGATALCLAVLAGSQVVSVLPATASASTKGYHKTMHFKAKKCSARVRRLPHSARIARRGADKGQLIYGKASRHRTLSFTCVHGRFSSEAFGRVLTDSTTSVCKPPNAPHRPPWTGPWAKTETCAPYPSTPISGTNVRYATVRFCGASSGDGPACWSRFDYVLTLHKAWILLEASRRSSSPVPWIVTMLQHSTFHVKRGAGGKPNNPFVDQPEDWTLPNDWLLSP